MNKTKVMFYADSWKATSGYSRVVRELASRLATNDKYIVYVQQIVSQDPAYVDKNVKVLPVFGQRGTEQFLNSLVNNIRMVSPNVIIPICDPFLLYSDGLTNIDFAYSKLMPYIPLDSVGIPDLSDALLDKADHIFIMSHDGKEQLDAAGYTNSSVLYHGVNLKEFESVAAEVKSEYRKEFGFSDDDDLFLFIGRNFPRKRPLRMIEAIAYFMKTFPENKAKFLMHVSDHNKNPYDLIKFIERMEKKYSVNLDNIIFTKDHKLGFGLKDGDFLKLYKMADYYITSTSGEGFGLPTIEAMAAKLPVIIPKNSTGVELSGNGEWAYLVGNEGFQNTGFGTQQPLVDIKLLADAISDCIELDNTEKVEKAYNFVKNNCNWDMIAIELQRQIENETK